jgi:predicted nucleotide-binding protein (sugar kinase/HSP70/actin superfamily)
MTEKNCLKYLDEFIICINNTNFKEYLDSIIQIIFYLINNNFLKVDSFLEYYEKEDLLSYTWDFSKNKRAIVTKAIYYVINLNKRKVKSLLELSKLSIRTSIKSKSHYTIKQLNLPKHLEYYIQNASTLKKNDFNKLVKFSYE